MFCFGFAVVYFGFVVVVDFGPSMWLCYSIDKELLSIEILNKTPSHVIMSENQVPTLWLSLLIYMCSFLKWSLKVKFFFPCLYMIQIYQNHDGVRKSVEGKTSTSIRNQRIIIIGWVNHVK